jgi:hypothetical protein
VSSGSEGLVALLLAGTTDHEGQITLVIVRVGLLTVTTGCADLMFVRSEPPCRVAVVNV